MLLSTDIFDRPEQTHIPWEDFADTPNIDFQALKKSITAAAGAKVTEQLVDASLALVFETAGRAFSSASLDSLTFLEDGDSHSYAMGLPVDDLLLEFDQNGQLIKSESEERPAFIQSDYYNGGEFLSWEDDLFPVFAPQAAAAKGAAVASPNFPLSPQFSAEAEDSDDSSSDSDSDDSSDSSDAESVRPVATKKSVLTSGPKRSRSDGVLNEKRSSAAISRPAPKSSSTSNISNAKTSSLSTSSSSSSSSTSSNNAKSKTTPDIKRRRRTSAKNASSPNGKSLRPMTPPEQSVIEIVTEITTVSQSPLLRSCPTPKKGKIGLLSAATHDLSAETIRTIFQTEQVVTLTKATAGEEEEEEEIDIL